METKAFAFPGSSDGSWVWQGNKDILNLKYSSINSLGGGNPYYVQHSANPPYISINLARSKKKLSPLGDIQVFSLYILLFGTILILYSLIRFAVRKIYAQDFKNVDSNKLIKPGFLENRKINNRMFMTGLPYSGRGEVLAKYIAVLDKKKIAYGVIDFREIGVNDVKQVVDTGRKREVVFLMNFEYNDNNHESLKIKLQVLEKVLLKRETQIIVSSEIHPHQVTHFYERLMSKINRQGNSEELQNKFNEYRQHLKLWQQIFRGFIKVNHPLDIKDDDVPLSGKYEANIIKTIQEELRYGNYLKKLEPLVFQYYTELRESNPKFGTTNLCQEDIIVRIQTLAETYYQSIWNSLTKSEKYLIFDLAKDRFVNVKNDYDIKTLLSKGIFDYKDNLTLMNRSFNNFVLNVVGKDQEILMEKELRKKGSWSTIQLVLILTVISITVFIVLGQKNFVNEFNSLIGALAAVVGLLLRFGGVFTRSSSNIKA